MKLFVWNWEYPALRPYRSGRLCPDEVNFLLALQDYGIKKRRNPSSGRVGVDATWDICRVKKKFK